MPTNLVMTVVEVSADLLASLHCPKCDTEEVMLTSLSKVSQERGRCPDCGQHRVPKTFHTIDGREPFLDRTLGEIGVPPWDVLAGRRGLEQRFYEFAGDRREVLGPLEPGCSTAVLGCARTAGTAEGGCATERIT